MKKIRTLVIDDEPLARARILKLLEQFDEVDLLGECKNGKEALEKIEKYKPDLIFLDIQMPDFSGFDLISKSELEALPFIIFVTAYDQYAVKAFGVHAVDYLLKPYDDERFNHAFEHAKKQIALKRDALLHKKMVRLLEDHQDISGEQMQQIAVKDKGRQINIKVNDVYYLESHGNYLKIYLENRSLLHRQTLQTIEAQLDPEQFKRIHRSFILNMHLVKSIRYKGNNQYAFLMKNGQELLSSRGFKAEIEQLLEENDLKKDL